MLTLRMLQSSFQDSDLFAGVSFGDSDEDEDAAATEARSGRSHAALVQADRAGDAAAGATTPDSAAALAVPAAAVSPSQPENAGQANTAPATPVAQHRAVLPPPAAPSLEPTTALAGAPVVLPAHAPLRGGSGGSAAQLRQRATARWAQLLTLTSEERQQRALSPAAAEAAAEAEGLCLVRLPDTKCGLKICVSSCNPVLEAATPHAHAHAHAHAPSLSMMISGAASRTCQFFGNLERSGSRHSWPMASRRSSSGTLWPPRRRHSRVRLAHQTPVLVLTYRKVILHSYFTQSHGDPCARDRVPHATPFLCTDARSIGPEASHKLHGLASSAAPRTVRGAIEVCSRSTAEVRP